jgi:CMP-N,N'-diacetyllegionaminic acid synthase
MTKTLCFIPARGGSKRIPRKNLLPLAGKPLLAYTIEAALQAQVFEDVVVSSDDQEILNLAASLGAFPDRRPEVLCGDMIRFVQVVEEYLLRPGMRERYRNIASMLPTCPFRTAEDVRNAFELFARQDGDRVLMAVTGYDFPPQLALELAEDGVTLAMREPETYGRTTRSQSIRKAYHPNGAIYIATVEGFLRERTFFAEPLLGYVMPPERSFDIDYPYQFKIAEIIMTELLDKEENNGPGQ